MNFDDLFQAATGHRGPFDYQRRLACGEQTNAEWLQHGTTCSSRLINVPTGLGKTAAVVLAWLWNRLAPTLDPQPSTVTPYSPWPRRLVYCLPMRTLVEQTRANVAEWVVRLAFAAAPEHTGVAEARNRLSPDAQARLDRDAADLRRHTSRLSPAKEDLLWLAGHSPEILMGGEETGDWDLYPEKPCILIGTQDMLLSRALNRGYGMSRYRWPTHFGLLNNDCLWVIDETQSMGPGLWTSGQLDWMRNHRFGVAKPCISWWMSATLRPAFLETLDRQKDELPMPPVVEVVDEKVALSRLNPSRRLIFWKDTAPKAKKKGTPATSFSDRLAAAIRSEHKDGTLSLIVCNSVKAAQELYRTIGPEGVILLTSRFRRGDREEHTRRLLAFEEQRQAVAKRNPKDDTVPGSPGLICIATQVVEAGVDISARRLWMEAAPWPSAVQRFGRLNRDGAADGKACAFVFQWPSDGKKGKGQPAGPYDAKDIADSLKLLTKLTTIYEAEPTLGAKDAMGKLHATHGAEMDAALKPKDEPFPRALDVHGLFSTEPDVFGGFTDVSPWVRGADKNADVTVFWREFDAKKGPGKTDTLTGPTFDPTEGCTVAIHRFRDFLGDKGRALVWDERSERWQSLRPGEVCPGMVIMLPRTAGGYSKAFGWTGLPSDKLDDAPPPGRFGDIFEDDTASEQAGWVPLATHLADARAAAVHITSALQLDAAHRTAVVTAAELHDIGKAHPIWQGALPHANTTIKVPWAKAPPFGRFLPRPGPGKPCIRHEAASALAAWHQYFRVGAAWPGLTLFLIACHHGKVRTVLYARGEDGEDVCGVPKQPDSLPWNGGMPMDFACAAVGTDGEFSDDGLTFIPSSPGWTGLVADLLGGWEKRPSEPPPPLALHAAAEPRLLGPFALAYLESLICAADVHASKNPTDLRHV